MVRMSCTCLYRTGIALPPHTPNPEHQHKKPHPQARLEAMGSHYGAHPAHDALWHSAEATAHSLPARLAVEHCVHEARGCAARAPCGMGRAASSFYFATAPHPGRSNSPCVRDRTAAVCGRAQPLCRAVALADPSDPPQCKPLHARGPYPKGCWRAGWT